jgi:CelD/BcsL family acetyltransferase involved in cellulose biosynthesis
MTIIRASHSDRWLARDRAEIPPRRIAAGRTEWLSLAALAVFRAEWRELADRALEPNVFYDPDFALAAAPVFGAGVGAVLVWSKSGRLIGVFAIRSQRRYGALAVITGWTHPYAPFGVPLVDRDEAETAIAGFLNYIEAQPKYPRLLLLPLIARDGAFMAALSRVLVRHGGVFAPFGEHARALLAPEGERLTYLDRALTHKKHKELRRQRRRLLDKGLLKVETAREPDDMPRALTDYLSLEAAGWKGAAHSAALQNAKVRAFMQTALGALSAQGHARIDRLMQNGHPIAAAITLRAGTAAWFWKIAYDEDFARYSPGVQLSLDLTEALLAEPDMLRADSCATASHPMIDHLWRERLALTDLLIAPGGAALAQFRVARHLEKLRRELVDVAKRVRDGMK